MERQSKPFRVEILVMIDNKTRTTGAKRNALIEQAKGTFVSFVDDDDRIETDYVQTLVETIDKHPDANCIIFDVEVNVSGLEKKITKFDINYPHSQEQHAINEKMDPS